MVTLRETAKHIKDINEREWIILLLIEKNLRWYERYPVEKIIEKTKYSYNFAIEIIRKLSNLGWIEYFKQPYEGVRLLTSGADAIALKILADKNIIVGIGRQIGVGKESDIYEAIGANSETLSIKVFRLGRISFRDVTRKRNYFDVYSSLRPGWILRNYNAAKREYNILKFLYERGVRVPKPIACIKHIIVMEELIGDILANIKDLPNPQSTFWEIINEVKKAYNLNIINGDLSPFNIFITNDYNPIIIDWPQATEKGKNKIYLLKRDLNNLISFFEKKYNLKVDVKKIYKLFNIP